MLNSNKLKPNSLLVSLSVIFVLINLRLSAIVAHTKGISGGEYFGYVYSAIFLPVIIAAIFSIWKSKRNFRSQTQAFFVTSLLLFLVQVGQFTQLLSQ